jgi:uncharacterized protein YecE (DUF72 family)
MAMEAYPQRFPVVEIQHTFYEPPSNPCCGNGAS